MNLVPARPNSSIVLRPGPAAESVQLPVGLDAAAASIAAVALPLPRLGPLPTYHGLGGVSSGPGMSQYTSGKLGTERPLLSNAPVIPNYGFSGSTRVATTSSPLGSSGPLASSSATVVSSSGVVQSAYSMSSTAGSQMGTTVHFGGTLASPASHVAQPGSFGQTRTTSQSPKTAPASCVPIMAAQSATAGSALIPAARPMPTTTMAAKSSPLLMPARVPGQVGLGSLAVSSAPPRTSAYAGAVLSR